VSVVVSLPRRPPPFKQRFPDRSTLQLQWVDPVTNRRKTKSAETSDEDVAESKRKDLEYELTHGLYQEPARLTWERFREQFEEEYVAPLRQNTRENYRSMLDLFEELCNPKQLRSVTERTVSAFVAGMRKRPTRGRDGMQPGTIKVRLQFLHTALSWAVEQKMLPAVPRFPTVKVPKKKPQPIPAESFEKILAKATDDAPMATYLLCGWLAGLRLSEALHMEGEPTNAAAYIDLTRQRIVLPAEIAKSVEDQWVPLDPVLREALLALPRHGKKVFRFEDPREGHLISLSAMSDHVAALAKRAGVKLTMHSLRKGFGCRYAGKVSAHVLQRLMRHANIKTTMDYYANIDKAVEEAVLGPQCNGLRNTPTNGLAVVCEQDSASSFYGSTSGRS
jgi:integrase